MQSQSQRFAKTFKSERFAIGATGARRANDPGPLTVRSASDIQDRARHLAGELLELVCRYEVVGPGLSVAESVVVNPAEGRNL